MQRRSFLRNAACVGACASLFSPLRDAFAGESVAESAVVLKFERLSAHDVPVPASTLQMRVVPQQFGQSGDALRVRAWFVADGGATAFDLASFGRHGASQRLRFSMDARRLIGFELGRGRHFDDCAAVSACGVRADGDTALGPGAYRLSLIRDGQPFAAVDLDVSAAAA
ncbi:MAG TPA: hypothetical protein PLB00_08150 [Pseudomonadota bacterium]|nr:hypothetical protein [Pseudomonadota bacterium]